MGDLRSKKSRRSCFIFFPLPLFPSLLGILTKMKGDWSWLRQGRGIWDLVGRHSPPKTSWIEKQRWWERGRCEWSHTWLHTCLASHINEGNLEGVPQSATPIWMQPQRLPELSSITVVIPWMAGQGVGKEVACSWLAFLGLQSVGLCGQMASDSSGFHCHGLTNCRIMIQSW